MSATAEPTWIGELALTARQPPEFFTSIDQILRNAPALQAHSLHRAWQALDLCGILCLAGQPVAYFREAYGNNPSEDREVFQKLWNHGVAPLLIVMKQKSVEVYSSLSLPPRSDENTDAGSRLVETFDRVAQALELRQLVRRIELGEYFGHHARSFNPDLRVDRVLLDNLDAVREKLHEGAPKSEKLEIRTVLALLGRTIFTCYLVDRQVIGPGYFAAVGAPGVEDLHGLLEGFEPNEAIRLLYRLFGQLKRDFNGDLFQGDLAAEQTRISNYHIDILRRFLRGDQLRTGQLSLGVWPYDFSVVPIETISAIYESFLELEGNDEKRAIGAYYTPRFLTEIVLDTALEGFDTILDKRFLDPACGSGIFLVGLFTRLAVEWRRHYPDADNQTRAQALIGLLLRNLYGIDANETACRIAAFSLYLAFLDQLEPRDIQLLQERGSFLPKLVLGWEQHPGDEEAGANILCRDFFDRDLPLPDSLFDAVVGNPPWTKARDRKMAQWCKDNGPQLKGRRVPLPVAQDQLSHGFLWKIPRHLGPSGIGCLVLPAGLLLNHQAQALAVQRDWLQRYRADRIINLSDLSSFLFERAARPALVVRFKNEPPDKASTRVEYFTPTTEYEAIHAEILRIGPNDHHSIRLAEVFHELAQGRPPLVWKALLWGTLRDRQFLERLRDYPTLGELTGIGRGKQARTGRWLLGEGFNKGGKGEPVNRPELYDLPFLPSIRLSRYVVARNSTKPHPSTYAPRYLGKDKIFRAPHLLFPHGVPRKGDRIKIAFCSFDCSFEHSIRGIHGPEEDEDLLRFLTCVLASPLALYFFFHTSANWGSERAKIHVEEYGRFPFPLPNSEAQWTAVRQIADLHREMEAEVESNSVLTHTFAQHSLQRLDEFVYAYYELTEAERALVNDTVNIWIPSATPSRSTKTIIALQPSEGTERETYLSTLAETLNQRAARGGQQIRGRCVVSHSTGAGIVVLERASNAPLTLPAEIDSPIALERAIGRIQEVLGDRRGSVETLRDLKVFSQEEIYILKPLARRYWTRTAALNDADEITVAILSAWRKTR